MKPILQQLHEARLAGRPLGSFLLTLSGHLLAHPVHAARYLVYSHADNPLSCGLPWWSFGAIDFVNRFTRRRGLTAFEFGTGGSTIYLAQRCGSVTCVENDERWRDLTAATARARGLANVTIAHEPTSVADCADFGATSYFQSLAAAGTFDVIVVDGEDFYQQNPASYARPLCFFEAERHVKPGGLIVVDDATRYPTIRDAHGAKRHHRFHGVGPCRYGLTTTDVYEY